MRRAALGLLVVLVVAGAFWIFRGGGPGARAAPPEHGADEPAEAVVDVAAFVKRLETADPEARRATAKGPVPDAVIAAAVEALDAEWAKEFLRALGERALPALEERCLKGGNGGVKAFWIAADLVAGEREQRLYIAAIEHPDHQMRSAALTILGFWCDEGGASPLTPIGPALQQALFTALDGVADALPDTDEGNLRNSLLAAIPRSLDDDGNDLRRLLASKSPVLRAAVIELVPMWALVYDEEGNPTPARPAVALLLPLILDPDPDVRRQAVIALGQLESYPVPKEPLAARLDDPNETPEVRAAAARLLGYHGGHDALRRHLDDPSATVRAAVLGGLQPDQKDISLAEMRVCLDDPDADVRFAAAQALGRAVPDEVSRARLAQGLEDPDESVRYACLEALSEGAPPVEAIPHLGRWIAEGSDRERSWAVSAARALKEKAAPLEMAIVEAVDKTTEFREHRIEALRDLPGQDERVLAALVGWTRDPYALVRRSALSVLIARFGDRPATLDALDRALADENGLVVAVAAERLAAMGRNLPAVVAACVRVLKGGRGSGASDVIETLATCGAAAREAAPALLAAMDDGFGPTAAKALGALPELADLTVPGLVARGARGHGHALAALDALGAAAEPHLSTALDGLEPTERRAFEDALAAHRNPPDEE